MADQSRLGVWSWRPKNSTMQNFGDELGPYFLELLGYKIRRVPLADADLVTAGSVLGTVMAKGKDGLTVWGSGFIKPPEGLPSRRLNIAAVRGRLTAQALELPATVALGDPGLLASRFWRRPAVRHKVGVVPHYVDKRTFPWADVTIDVTKPVDDVVAEIASCATIVSSSLHGIIVAQAYGIPVMRLQHNKVIGGNYKWADFQSSMISDIDTIQQDLTTALAQRLNDPKVVVTPDFPAPRDVSSETVEKKASPKGIRRFLRSRN